MYIVYAKHEGDPEEYLFEVRGDLSNTPIGTIIVVNTIKGEALATTTTLVQWIDVKDRYPTEKLIELSGAYLPLREVVKIADIDKLTNVEKELVSKEWLAKKMGFGDSDD